ncbi:hypothetical protein GS682_27205 [Nostoc sp. B(2019)]|nr:hypothetical protein [Nostoc sp. B(2019)]
MDKILDAIPLLHISLIKIWQVNQHYQATYPNMEWTTANDQEQLPAIAINFFALLKTSSLNPPKYLIHKVADISRTQLL